MVKMVEVIVRNPSGEVVKRVTVNEELFNYVLKKSMESRQDMTTAWFLRLMRAIFEPTGVGGPVSASTVDTGGTARTTGTKRATGGASPQDDMIWNTSYCNNRLWIGWGTSTTSPTRTDYKLGNKVAEGIAGVTHDETQGTVTISASFTMTTDTTIYEVGLEWEGTVATYNVCGRILLDRTVFSAGITVLANQTVTIVYRFIFP
jgi:hypothetical protein